MKYLILLVFIFIDVSVNGQQDSAGHKNRFETYLPLIILTKQQIRNLPVSSFSELVNSAFPFVSSTPFIAEDYSYEVDGYVTINPNAINISHIESITFYPGGTRHTKASLMKNGTFVIKIEHPEEKNLLSLSTKTGLTLPNQRYSNSAIPAGKFETESDPSLFSLNEASYIYHSRKFFIGSSFSFLRNGETPTTGTRNGDTVLAEHVTKRYRFSDFLGYHINENLKVDAGLFFTSQENGNYYRQSYHSIPSFGESAGADRANYFGVALGLKAILFRKIENQFRAEGNYIKYHGGTAGNMIFNNNQNSFVSQFMNRTENYSLSNLTRWDRRISAQINMRVDIHFRYRWKKLSISSGNTIFDNNGMPTQVSAQWMSVNARSFSASPEVSLQVKELLAIKGGVSYDNYGASTIRTDPEMARFYPHAGIRFDAGSLLHSHFISELYLSSEYSHYLVSSENQDILNVQSGQIFAGNTVYIFDEPNLNAERWITGVGGKVFQSRVGVKLNYLREKLPARIWLPVPIGGNMSGYGLAYRPIKRDGWSMELTTTVIETQSGNLKLWGTLNHEKFILENNSFGLPYSAFNPNYVFLTDKKLWKSSVGTTATFGNIFMQASAILSYNEPRSDAPPVYYYVNNHVLNFLLAGYRFPLQKSELKNFEINLQTRNLGLPLNTRTKAYMNRFIGIGIQADL